MVFPLYLVIPAMLSCFFKKPLSAFLTRYGA
jgi:hypothetical protein